MGLDLHISSTLGLLLAACSGRDPSTLFAPDTGTLVVSSTLVVGQTLPPVFLTQTVAPDEPLESLSAVVVKGAVVNVTFGTVTLTYVEDASGVYWPPPGAPQVQHSTTYSLLVVAPDGRIVYRKTGEMDLAKVREKILSMLSSARAAGPPAMRISREEERA